MKLNTRRCWLIAGLAFGVMGSGAVAQVAPPPAQPAKEVKEASPKAESAPAPVAKPVQKSPAPSSAGPQSSVQRLPTKTPYPKLITKNDNGKINRLIDLPGILALRSNPTIGAKSVDAIMPVIYGRRARFERIIIENLDLYWLATDGRLENISMSDIKELSQLAEMIKPLVGKTTFSQELQNRGILTRTQGGMNAHIVNEYKQAVTTEIQFDAEDPLSSVMQFVLEDSIHETILAYKAMIAEASYQIADVVDSLELASSAATAISKLQRPLNEDTAIQQAQLAEFEKAFRSLSIEEGIEVFTAMRKLRKNSDMSPAVKRPDVMHARKVDISDSDAMEGTINYGDGRKINTQDMQDAHDAKQREKRAKFLKEKNGETQSSDD